MHGSPVVVFSDRGHPHFWNFYYTIPVDIVRVKSYMNCLFDLCFIRSLDQSTSSPKED